MSKAEREVAIHRVLERIRKLSLAMKTTEDIGPVVVVTRDALMDLGIEPFRTMISVQDKRRDEVKAWTARRGDRFAYGEGSVSAFHKAGSVLFGQRPGRKRWVLLKWNKRQLASELRKIRKTIRMDLPADWLQQQLACSPSPFYQHIFYMSGGCIGLATDRELDRGEIAVARRVTEAFGFAYKRLVDLQNKERRAREAEVEAALERVRARALGMQDSTEISEVTSGLFTEFRNLGFAQFRTGIIVLHEEEEEAEVWLSRAEGEVQPGARMSMDLLIDTKWAKDGVEAIRRGDRRFVRELKGKEAKEALRRLQREAGGSGLDFSAKGAKKLPDTWHVHWINFSNGCLYLTCPEALSEDHLLVGERFADVFAMAYSRFKELEEKEAQNRELAVEAALERVRGKALAMEVEQDLSGVAYGLFEELDGLGFDLLRSTISTIDREAETGQSWFALTGMVISAVEGLETVYAGPKREALRSLANIPAGEGRDRIRAWLAGERFLHQKRSGKSARRFLESRLVRERPDLGKAINWRDLPDTEHHYLLYNKYGFVHVVSSGELSDEQIATALRFGDLFGFSYSRFKELEAKQKANRELALEAALERVRGAALAMTTSNDLEEAAAAMFEELQALSLPILRCGLAVADSEEDPKAIELWGRDSAGSVSRGVHFPLDEHPVMVGISKAWLDGEDLYLVEVQGEPMEDWLRYMRDDLSYPMEWPDLLDVYRNYCVFFPHGLLYVVAPERLADGDLNVVRRFRDGFAFAYSRYLELAEKERQNRELTIQNALERVRAQALSMQASEDLLSVAHVLGEQMAVVGIQSIVTSIEVVDREDGMFRSAAMLESVEMTDWEEITMESFQTIGVHNRMLEAFDRGDDVLVARLEGEECREHQQFWIEMLFESNPQARDLGYPDQSSVMFTLVFFSRGWIFLELGSTVGEMGQPGFQLIEGDPLSEENLATVKRFAEMFDFAYSRFLELKEKEDQNRELTIQNALERVRARALGMQESRELSEVSYTLSNVLGELVQGYIASSLITIDEEARVLYDHQQLPGWAPGDVLPVVRFEIDEIDPSAPIAHVKEAYEARASGDAVYARAFNSKDTVAIIKWINRYYEEHYPHAGLKLPETAPEDVSYICVASQDISRSPERATAGTRTTRSL